VLLRESLKTELSMAGYNITGKLEQGTIYVLGHYEKHKSLNIDSIFPEIDLRYTLPFEKLKGKSNLLKFEINIGYICDENQNVIYFHLFEISEKPEILVDDFLDKVRQSLPEEWENGVWEETNDNIYVQFSIDEFLSAEKIDNLFKVFKENVLIQTINELERKFNAM